MGFQFHETVRGKIFFESQLPSLIKAINRVADALEQKNEGYSEINMDTKGTLALYRKMQLKTQCRGMLCPRCGNMLNPSVAENALSRHEDIYICSDCGTEETLLDAQKQVLPLEAWFLIKSEERKESE